MSKNLIKPVENADFWEARSSPCELRPAGLGPFWARLVVHKYPPPFIWMGGWPEKSPEFLPKSKEGGGYF